LSTEIVLTGILFVLSEGCAWRAIHRPGAHWNAIYQYYREWCRIGLWARLWEEHAREQKGVAVYVDASHVKVHQCGLNPAGGRETQAVGLTKGGWNTKIHAAVDGAGRPRALLLTAGNEADVNHAEGVMGNLKMKIAVLDKGYDSDSLRIWLFERGVTPCIPSKSNRIDPLPYSKRSYRKRHLVENFFQRIKTFRRVATRYDKLAETYFGWVLLASLIKFGSI
jgi:transposase